MVRVTTRSHILLIGLGVALMGICFGVVFVIDTHFSLDPWNDSDVEALWYFLVGCIFFPGALRRYRAGRQGEPKVPWYHRLDLIGCLIGFAFGLEFILSGVRKWMWSLLMNDMHSPIVNEGSLRALDMAILMVILCWIILVLFLFYQKIKQIKQLKTEPSQTT